MRHFLLSVLALIIGVLGAMNGVPFALGAVLTTEIPVLTQRRLESLLSEATPGAQAAFRAWFSFMMQQRSELKMQLVGISNLTVDINPLDGIIAVYAVYLKKQATATAAYFKIFDDATDDTTAADARVALGLLTASKEEWAFWPDGLNLTDGLVIGSYTALIGSNNVTPTTTGDGPNGFMLVGTQQL